MPLTRNKNATIENREKLDFYPTPRLCVLGILQHLRREGVNPQSILDLGCGEGVWGQMAQLVWPDATLYGVDIVARNEGIYGIYNHIWIGDFLYVGTLLDPDLFDGSRFDLVMGNPPYRYAEDFVRRAIALTSRDVVMLLRANFLAGVARNRDLYEDHPLYKYYVLPERPYPFVDEFVVYHWRLGHEVPTVIDRIWWKNL